MKDSFPIRRVDHIRHYVGNARQAAFYYQHIFGFNITTNNFALSNGTINGMGGAGVEVRGTGTRIDGLRVANSGGGIIVNQAVISNCTVTTNAGNGILVESSVNPIALFQVRGNTTVNQSIISFNGGFGIGGNGNGTAFLAAVLASNNSVFQNGQDGMNDVTLAVNNMIYGNVGFGFSCDSNAVCSFEGNVLLNNSLGVTKNSTSLGHNFCGGTVC